VTPYIALTELKSIRAQQAEPPAGCAEMAKAVRVAINEHLDKHPMNGEVSFAGCEDELIEEAVAAKLAPLFTLQSDMYSLLLECREYTMQRVTLRTLNHDKGKALLAKLYAALGKGDADGGREVVK